MNVVSERKNMCGNVSDIGEPITKKMKSVDSKEKDSCGVEHEYKQDKEQLTVKTSQENHCQEFHQKNIQLDDVDGRVSLCKAEDNDLFEFPPDDDITDMIQEVKYGLHTITDRYFFPYYKLNVQGPGDDICVLVHTNRICMLTLAPSHVLFQSGKKITKVDFKVSDKLDRSLNKVSGKSKHGAQPLQANSNICTISCSNGETYTIKCCMIGKLVEVNDSLIENPELLLQPPHRGGYLAIVLPNITILEKMQESLLTEEQYKLSMLERQS